MAKTQTDGGRSSLGRLVLLALTFAVGYVLGSQRGGGSEEWEDAQKEPTEITIDGDEDAEE
jgi:hypothetical protein